MLNMWNSFAFWFDCVICLKILWKHFIKGKHHVWNLKSGLENKLVKFMFSNSIMFEFYIILLENNLKLNKIVLFGLNNVFESCLNINHGLLTEIFWTTILIFKT